MKDYKKILEGVANIINTTKKSDIGFVNICTYISENCPELRESEDERTWLTNLQKEIDCLRCDIRDYKNLAKLDYLQRALAWLESNKRK